MAGSRWARYVCRVSVAPHPPRADSKPEHEPEHELDLRGEVCPFTFVRAKVLLEDLPLRARVRLIVDHRPAVTNVPASLTAWGQRVVAVTPRGPGEWIIEVEKAAD